MNNFDILKKLSDSLHEIIGDFGELNLHQSIRSVPGWDSLVTVNLLAKLCNDLSIDIPITIFTDVSTINDLIQELENILNQK